jgi:hypothetical protein
MALARRYPKARIAFTGGSIEILSAPTVGADAARVMFRDLGLADGDRLLLESKARDTWENAVLTKALVQPKPGERWLLVTSAWQMPRSMGVFRKTGFAVEPWPVDYRTADAWDLLRLFDAPADGLKRLDTAVREWIGLVSYRVTGRSDALFPGPYMGSPPSPVLTSMRSSLRHELGRGSAKTNKRPPLTLTLSPLKSGEDDAATGAGNAGMISSAKVRSASLEPVGSTSST